ncbi:MAG TPA: IS1380 family transposase [Mycobacteriales bacterium]|nr:IS1380 family transposase [Mycobacteriales bacterium]
MTEREGTPWVKGNGRAKRVRVAVGGEPLVSSAGGSMLVETARATGLVKGLSKALAPWRPARAEHDPGKVVLDLAVAIALGGDCLADLAVVRAQSELFGAVASDPTVSRLVERLAGDADAAVRAIRMARADARARGWSHRSPVPATGRVVVDLDATLVTAHSEKEGATPTFKRGFGFHPLFAFVDHGRDGTGEPLAGMLREGRAGANTAADQIAVLDAALAQLPDGERCRVLVRGDTASGVHAFVEHVVALELEFSVGIYAHGVFIDTVLSLPEQCWKPAVDLDGEPRDGAHVAELTRWLPALENPWPAGTRFIARREEPHPGAQLRLTDIEGRRITLFATNTRGGRICDLELRHRMRARAEDRVRILKDCGLRNLPLHEFTKNTIWLELVQLAAELLAWTQTLAFPASIARFWEPKRLRLRLLHVAGRLLTTGRREWLRLPRGWPWNDLLITGHATLHAL